MKKRCTKKSTAVQVEKLVINFWYRVKMTVLEQKVAERNAFESEGSSIDEWKVHIGRTERLG